VIYDVGMMYVKVKCYIWWML